MDKIIIPDSRPKIDRLSIERHLESNKFDLDKHGIIVVGLRGYYKKTMGDPLKNDIGIYDDAGIIISKSHFSTYNFNTDPSENVYGRATLVPDIYFVHCLDLHKGDYLALCQRHGKVNVSRFGKIGIFSGNFGVNIHRGGLTNTWSEACQTVYSKQWTEFINNITVEVDKLRNNKSRFEFIVPYGLFDNW